MKVFNKIPCFLFLSLLWLTGSHEINADSVVKSEKESVRRNAVVIDVCGVSASERAIIAGVYPVSKMSQKTINSTQER